MSETLIDVLSELFISVPEDHFKDQVKQCTSFPSFSSGHIYKSSGKSDYLFYMYTLFYIMVRVSDYETRGPGSILPFIAF